MQSADDAEERIAAADVDSAAPTERTYGRLCDIFLVVAAGCAAVVLGIIHIPPYLISDDFDAPWLVEVWLAPLLSALVSFAGAFLCALGCRQSRRLLRHVGVVLADLAVMALMYVYQPWYTFDTGRERIVYVPFWSPPVQRVITIDGVPVLAVDLLIAQYMLVILVSSILILLLTRKPAAQVG